MTRRHQLLRPACGPVATECQQCNGTSPVVMGRPLHSPAILSSPLWRRQTHPHDIIKKYQYLSTHAIFRRPGHRLSRTPPPGVLVATPSPLSTLNTPISDHHSWVGQNQQPTPPNMKATLRHRHYHHHYHRHYHRHYH
jgi:hypothetical protein